MFSDLRYAFRALLKSPGFTAVAVITLALGIGACTAIFSVVIGVLLRPLDFPQPERILVIRESQLPQYPEFSVSPPDFIDWQQQAKSFASLAAYTGAPLNLTGDAEPLRLIGVKATAHYFEVYGIKPVVGRVFSPEEDTVGKDHVVVVSHAFWQRVLGGGTDVIGRTLQLNGEPFSVIGVVPPGFGQQSKVDAWLPMAFTGTETDNKNRGSHYVSVVGRLAPGASAQQADAELKLIAAQIARQYPDSNKGWSAFATPLLDYSVRDVRSVLYTLLGAVGCVLLIACANIANLLLARATARHREISIRSALGAGRSRLIRQLLTESVLLAVLGGIGGLLLARWGLDALLSFAPANLPRAAEIRMDGTVLAVALALSAVTGIVFGLAPAWLAAQTNVNEALKQGSRGSTEGGARGRLRGTLVIVEVAAAFVLLVGAGLLIRSFAALAHVDPGFTAQDATVVRLTLPEKKYATPAKQLEFANALTARLRELPGVKSVGVTHTLPLAGDWVEGVEIEGEPKTSSADLAGVNYYGVSADYFHAMGTRLIQGRAFTDRDAPQSPRVSIVNETFVKRYFPHTNPIGRRISVTVDPETTWREIVGVVADIAQYGVDQVAPCQVYDPFAQHPQSSLNFVVRHGGSPAAFLNALRPAVYSVDKDQPIGRVQPLTEIVAGTIARQRFAMMLLTVFSLVALLIAAVGIYGVMAYNVTQRTSELGIRMALGAQPSDVLRLVFSQGGRLIGLGLILGLVLALAGGRALESMLFATSTFDPLTLIGITALLAIVASIACLVPARRATRVDPVVALRNE
jgi:putative ABC transport system permease protein